MFALMLIAITAGLNTLQRACSDLTIKEDCMRAMCVWNGDMCEAVDCASKVVSQTTNECLPYAMIGRCMVNPQTGVCVTGNPMVCGVWGDPGAQIEQCDQEELFDGALTALSGSWEGSSTLTCATTGRQVTINSQQRIESCGRRLLITGQGGQSGWWGHHDFEVNDGDQHFPNVVGQFMGMALANTWPGDYRMANDFRGTTVPGCIPMPGPKGYIKTMGDGTHCFYIFGASPGGYVNGATRCTVANEPNKMLFTYVMNCDGMLQEATFQMTEVSRRLETHGEA